MYRKINVYMSAGKKAAKNKELDRIIGGINSVMRVSTLNEDKDVYRGMKSSSLFKQIMAGEKEIQINSFQSTSISKEVSERYAGNVDGESTLIKIRLPKGTHCVGVSQISSAPQKEEEILLNSTGKFKVERVCYNSVSKQLEVEAHYER